MQHFTHGTDHDTEANRKVSPRFSIRRPLEGALDVDALVLSLLIEGVHHFEGDILQLLDAHFGAFESTDEGLAHVGGADGDAGEALESGTDLLGEGVVQEGAGSAVAALEQPLSPRFSPGVEIFQDGIDEALGELLDVLAVIFLGFVLPDVEVGGRRLSLD
jgi:hypothetical protein